MNELSRTETLLITTVLLAKKIFLAINKGNGLTTKTEELKV